MEYELHPLCVLFPRMVDDAFIKLTADIKANGLREPIILHDGMILDGGNRYRACIQAGVEPRFTEFQGGDPISFVLSANFHRRHLSAGQQAAVVSAMQNWEAAAAHGGQRRTKADDPDQSASLAPCSEPATSLSTATDRAKASGASLRTQKMADKVAKADPDLAVKVAHGEVSLPEAVEKITGKRPGARPAKAAEQESHEAAMAEATEDFDPIAELEVAQREIELLNARIKAMSVDDTGKELAKQIEIRQGIEGRLAQETTKVHELDRQLRRMGKIMEDLRKLTGAESNSAVVAAVRAMVRKAA